MKDSILTQAIDQAIKIKLEAVDKFLTDYIEPLGELGNPEKLIGKPYETWTPEDLQQLAQIYGDNPQSLLAKFIFRKEYEKVLKMEAEVK